MRKSWETTKNKAILKNLLISCRNVLQNKSVFLRKKVADINSNIAHLKSLISQLFRSNKLYAYMHQTPIFKGNNMCISRHSWNKCVIKQKWIIYKFELFHEFLNTLMKLGRNTERKYSMQVMSITTATIATKWKFRFTRGFMLVLELKGFYSGASNILDIFKRPQSYF